MSRYYALLQVQLLLKLMHRDIYAIILSFEMCARNEQPIVFDSNLYPK
jgi:hypothetical protein